MAQFIISAGSFTDNEHGLQPNHNFQAQNQDGCHRLKEEAQSSVISWWSQAQLGNPWEAPSGNRDVQGSFWPDPHLLWSSALTSLYVSQLNGRGSWEKWPAAGIPGMFLHPQREKDPAFSSRQKHDLRLNLLRFALQAEQHQLAYTSAGKPYNPAWIHIKHWISTTTFRGKTAPAVQNRILLIHPAPCRYESTVGQ